MALQISPLGLPANYTAAVIPVSVSLTGVSANANAGNPQAQSSQTGVFSELGPLILPSPLRNIQPVVGNVDIFVLGAQARAQGEELEGANATVYLDGARSRAGAGLLFEDFVEEAERITPGGNAAINFSNSQKSRQQKKRMAQLLKELYDMSLEP